jgi:hypothetical protein
MEGREGRAPPSTRSVAGCAVGCDGGLDRKGWIETEAAARELINYYLSGDALPVQNQGGGSETEAAEGGAVLERVPARILPPSKV